MQNITKSPVEKVSHFPPISLRKNLLFNIAQHPPAPGQYRPNLSLHSTFIFIDLQENNRKHNNA